MERNFENNNHAYEIRKINVSRLEAIKEFSGHSILDVGCGNGAYVNLLCNEFNIKGVDYQEFESWNMNRELFRVSDAISLPFQDNSFETILCFETLEHLSEPDAALKEFHRVCSKNIIITVPNCTTSVGMQKSGVIFNHWVDRTHVNFWNPNSLRKTVEINGFKVISERLINNLRIGYLLSEAMGLDGKSSRFFAGFFNRFLQRKKYFTTTLLVAEKSSLNDIF